MSLVTVPGGLWLPSGMGTHRVVAPSVGNFGGIADANDAVAHIFRAPKSGVLEHFEFLLASVSTFPATGIRLSWQDVDASGFPDGVVDQFAVISVPLASNAWAVPPNALTDDGTSGGTKRTVTRGDLLAAVIDIAPTFSTGNFQNNGHTSSELTGALLFPYSAVFSTAWAKLASFYPILAVKYDDGSYESIGPMVWPYTANGTTNTFNSGSTPDEYALRFQVPFSAELGGGWINILGGGDFDIVLYDNASNVLASLSIDKDQLQDSATGRRMYFTFATPVTLSANTVYRLAIKPTTGSNVSIYHLVANSNAVLGAMPAGKEFYKSTRTDGGAWSDQDTHWPLIGLNFNAIQDGASTPGPIVVTASDGLR